MVQDPLFHEDFRDSLKHMIKALGGFEAVGSELWPAKTRKVAGSWLSDALNPERPAKLDIDELVRLLHMGRSAGVHCAMHQLADDCGYARPAMAAARTRAQQLAEQFQRKAAELKHIADEMASAEADEDARRPNLREVR